MYKDIADRVNRNIANVYIDAWLRTLPTKSDKTRAAQLYLMLKKVEWSAFQPDYFSLLGIPLGAMPWVYRVPMKGWGVLWPLLSGLICVWVLKHLLRWLVFDAHAVQAARPLRRMLIKSGRSRRLMEQILEIDPETAKITSRFFNW